MPLSIEHRKKISESSRGLVKKKNSPKKSKKVCQYDLNYELIQVFPSMMEAHRQTGIAQPNISACCNGKLHSVGGYFWSYYEED